MRSGTRQLCMQSASFSFCLYSHNIHFFKEIKNFRAIFMCLVLLLLLPEVGVLSRSDLYRYSWQILWGDVSQGGTTHALRKAMADDASHAGVVADVYCCRP